MGTSISRPTCAQWRRSERDRAAAAVAAAAAAAGASTAADAAPTAAAVVPLSSSLPLRWAVGRVRPRLTRLRPALLCSLPPADFDRRHTLTQTVVLTVAHVKQLHQTNVTDLSTKPPISTQPPSISLSARGRRLPGTSPYELHSVAAPYQQPRSLHAVQIWRARVSNRSTPVPIALARRACDALLEGCSSWSPLRWPP
jgi:hypothetical protein